MTTKTDEQLRELDEWRHNRILDQWIDEHVFLKPHVCLHFDVKTLKGSLSECQDCREQFGLTTLAMSRQRVPYYHRDNDSTLLLLEKCAEKSNVDIRIGQETKYTLWWYVYSANINPIAAPTLPNAICLFAKRLFGG